MKEFVLILFILTASCSTNDEPKPGCFQESNRRIVGTIKGAEGIILGSQCSGKTFLIDPVNEEYSGPLGRFMPCNLPEEFQLDSIRVMFSGYLYESFDNEDICADFFEITEIRFDD